MSAAAEKARPPAVRALRIQLLGFAGEKICDAVVAVAASDFPEIVLFNGDPYLRCDDAGAELRAGTVFYQQVRPYRLDAGA